MSNAMIPASLQGLPAAALAHYSPQGDFKSQFGSISRQDIGINMLKVVQGTSPQARPGWGPTKQEPALALNTMFLSRDTSVVPVNSRFVPLLRHVTFIKWEGRDTSNKRIEFSTNDRNDRRIAACDGLSFKKDERTGKLIAPLVTEYINYYVMLSGVPDEPVLISFKRTSVGVGRKLTQDLLRCTKYGMVPMHAFMFTLNAPINRTAGTQAWAELSYSPAGTVDDAIFAKAEKMFELAQMLADTTSAEALEDVDTEPSEDAAPAQPAQQQAQITLNVAPTVVHQPTSQQPLINVTPTVVNPPTPQQQQAAPMGPAPIVPSSLPF